MLLLPHIRRVQLALERISSSRESQCLYEREMGRVRSFFQASLPYAAMLTLEFLGVGLATLSKAAMSKGMSHFIFVLYSNALATLLLFPASLIFLRGRRPPITFSLLCKFFLLGLFGINLMQNCLFTGLNYSSPTLASSINQLVPALTFFLAVIFRMERLDLTSSRSQMKVLGTLVSIAGALVLVLYKGPPVGSTTGPSLEPNHFVIVKKTENWLIGSFFLLTANLFVSIFTIFQAAVLKEYPSELTMISFYCLFGTIQCAVVSLIAERNVNAWKLKPDIKLISILYSAIFGNVVSYSAAAWCIHKKGPLFVALFKPLGIAIAAFMGAIFLGETLHVGSVVGAIIIVVGFYGVMWAQSKEEKQDEGKKAKMLQSSSASNKTPLLQSHSDV